jgi:hypothetical protein
LKIKSLGDIYNMSMMKRVGGTKLGSARMFLGAGAPD